MPSRSAAADSPRRWAGIAWAKDPSGRGWTPIFGGSSAPPGVASAVIVSRARSSRSSIGGIAASTSAADRYRMGARVGCIAGSLRPSATMAAMPLLNPRQSLENLKLERDAIVLYDALSRIERDGRRSSAFRSIATNERRHAEVWASKLRAQGID